MELAPKKIWLALLTFVLLSSCRQNGPFLILSCYDGDTCRAQDINSKVIKIRLACIDAPELSQKRGRESREFINDLVQKKNVTIDFVGKGAFKRDVAFLKLRDKSINLELLRHGMAEVYEGHTKYSKKECYKAQIAARHYKRGLWKDKNRIPPTLYRKLKRKGIL